MASVNSAFPGPQTIMEEIGMGRVLNYQGLFFKPPVESRAG
jgi:hypothetical protein